MSATAINAPTRTTAGLHLRGSLTPSPDHFLEVMGSPGSRPVCGVDPGATGAVAMYVPGRYADQGYCGWHVVRAQDSEGIHRLRGKALGWSSAVYVEQVGPAPMQSPSSAFEFGRQYERMVQMWAGATLVRPGTWQRGWAELEGLKGPERKGALWEIAKRYHPRVTKYAADAVLIAVYASRVNLKEVS